LTTGVQGIHIPTDPGAVVGVATEDHWFAGKEGIYRLLCYIVVLLQVAPSSL
jgi:hypothetical protein